MTLDYYIKNTIPKYSHPEWGFPKGRRCGNETNKECAIREFEEETNFSQSDYIIIDNYNPLIEEFNGTNLIKYKHIYYVGYATNNKHPIVNIDNHIQYSEIGNIGYYTYCDIMNMFRPYHNERKEILTKLYTYTCQKIISKMHTRNKIEK